MKLLKRIAIYILFIFIMVRCGDAVEEFDGFLPIEIEQLMASEDAKLWIRAQKTIDGEAVQSSCEDSLLFQFSRPISGVTTKNAIMTIYDPATCDSTRFCERYPNICEEMVNICKEDSAFCGELYKNAFLSGTWEAVEPREEGAKTREVKLNYPKDTTVVTIDMITSKEMQFSYQENAEGTQKQITEKYIAE